MARLTLGFLVFHLLIWTVLATLSHTAPPIDNMEQLVWMQSLEWGYYKHPPFPTWWVHFWTSLLGRNIWVTFFAAQLNVVIMLFFVWRIALMVISPARAFAAVVLTSLLIYHGVHGIMANHNTLQLMPVGLLLWLSLLAVRHCDGKGGWWRWALVGMAAALCLLTKYTAVLWMGVLLAWMLQDPRMRSWKAWGGVALALIVCVALVVPHIEWLVREGFPTLNYADEALKGQHDQDDVGHWGRLLMFLLIQLARALPLLLGLALMYLMVRRAPRQPAHATPAQQEWRFVAFMAAGPILLTCMAGAVGVRLGSAWAATFFVLLGVQVMRWVPEVSGRRIVKSALIAGLLLELLLASGMAVGSGWLVEVTGRQSRSNFPSAQLGRELDKVWIEHATMPMRLVVGETWLAGNVSVRSVYQPMVFIDADHHKSPWIKPSLLEDCGALIVVDRRDMANALNPRVAELLERASDKGMLSMPWTHRPNGPKLEVEWAIVQPDRPGACPA